LETQKGSTVDLLGRSEKLLSTQLATRIEIVQEKYKYKQNNTTRHKTLKEPVNM
jgi:hypothetical protein